MMHNGWQRMLVVLALLAAPFAAVAVPAAATAAPAYWCVKSHSPWGAYREWRAPLPHKCNAGYIIARVPAGTTQLVTVGAKSRRVTDKSKEPPQDRAVIAKRAPLTPADRQECRALDHRLREEESALQKLGPAATLQDEMPLVYAKKRFRELKC